MNKNILCRCVILAVTGSVVTAQAQEQSQPVFGLAQQPAELQPITIIGNTINDIDDTLPNVDVVNLNVLRNPSVNNLRDAVKKNPAVEINSSGNGSADQLRIRGFGENYTELTLDGQKMPEYFAFGPYTSGGRNFVETDTLKQIDIVKGLHSPKQNSGALAGSVNMQTYDPSDLVDADAPFFASLKTGYTSKDKGASATAMVAAAQGNLSGLVAYTRRHSHETKNMGNDVDKTLHDKQDIDQQNILAKGELAVENGSIILTGEYFDHKQQVIPRYNPQAKAHTDPTKRKRFKAEGNFTNVWGLDKASVQASVNNYSQTTETYGTSHFKQNNLNVQFDGVKQLDFGSMQHKFLFGAAYDNDEFDYRLDSKYGSIRYMPVTQRDTFTLYAKDQMTFANGLSVSPGIRIAHQRLSSDVDQAYRVNPALVAQDGYIPNGNTTVVTPSINVVMPINDNSNIFASYSRGARLADASNIGSFDHGFGFILPNPDLKTEKSNNYEIGFSYAVPDQLEFKVTGFYSQFRDFIDFERDGTFGVTSKGVPKSVLRPFNVNEAKTYGAELEAGYAINQQLYAHAAVAWMRGRIGNEASHGVTLSQAYPSKAIFGLSYNQDNKWGGNIDWTLAGKGQKPSKETQFRTPGFGVIDATGWWQPIDNLTITAGVYNITNKKYWLSSDVNGLPSVSRSGKPINLDNYTQPGRNFAINLRYDF
ncbi:TonB-dependent receptor [Cardiobacteriaceae bacterium TAE3-ERU3]|nr:TonB-dependent receptor [Cardiobacteriaceae bacterium TAE3-ERU3]